MKSLRVWFSGLALGAAVILSAPLSQAQVPNGFTYQGLLKDNGVPITDNVSLTFNIAGQSNTILYTETMTNVEVLEGIFNVVLRNFPPSMNFNEQYSMEVVVSNSNGTTTLPPTELWPAPYAINSGTVNGLSASPVPVAGDLFPVPIGTGYVGSAKIDPAFLPPISNNLLSLPLVVGNGSTNVTPLIVQNDELNGNEALLVQGGIGAGNAKGSADGSGLSSVSPQTLWADQVSVPTGTGTSLQIFNQLVSTGSTIIITPFESSAVANPCVITAQNAGSFTVSSAAIMGTGGGGAVTALNYLVINH